MTMMVTSCSSPEDKIREKMELKTEEFLKSDSDHFIQESEVCIYNTTNNINYLANEEIRELAIAYANNIGNSEYRKNQAQKYRSSKKTDKDYNPNWFEDAKRADEAAESLKDIATKYKSELLQLQDSIIVNTIGGIWVYHEITYKEYIYRYYAGPYVKRTLYLFSEDGESILWSKDIEFYDYTLNDILYITNTRYDKDSEFYYELKRTLIIVLIIILVIGFMVWKDKQITSKKKEKEAKIKAENIRIKKEQDEIILKKLKDWDNLLKERTEKYGNLTKQISLELKKEYDIYVYENSQTIFIMGDMYTFKDIISCNIEKILHKKGKTIQTAIPDKSEMDKQQMLWGMGQKYNVKTTTQIEATPDIYYYTVYIGINSISNPQIQFTLSSIDIANEINNLMNVIINYNKK